MRLVSSALAWSFSERGGERERERERQRERERERMIRGDMDRERLG
jgi:hypothetical protein